jgi:hypothetical protein
MEMKEVIAGFIKEYVKHDQDIPHDNNYSVASVSVVV